MAPPAAAALSLSHEELAYFYHHVFLPPQLPDVAEDGDAKPLLESSLMTTALQTLKVLRNYCPESQHILNHAIQGLTATTDILSKTDSAVSESALQQALQNVLDGKVLILPIYVHEQNAGLLVGNTNNGLVFEGLELAADNHAVVETKGRLRRTFPGCAVAVARDAARQPDFQTTLAQVVSKMSGQQVPGMQPKSWKAGSWHDEERDTTHPGAVTELLMSFLGAIGTSAQTSTIQKNTRDEVLFAGEGMPWRRSTIWTFLRVFLQLTFTRLGHRDSTDLYKAFMVYFMARIMETARRNQMPSAAIFTMKAKISRRMHKSSANMPEALRSAVSEACSKAGESIQATWIETQRHSAGRIDLLPLQDLDFFQDTLIQCPKLDLHIEALKARELVDRPKSVELQSGLFSFPADTIPSTKALCENAPYAVANLQAFEEWVTASLSTCLQGSAVDHACSRAHDLLIHYHSIASKVYAGNPEALSAMVLTVFEIWIALDKRASNEYQILADYDAGIHTDILQSLLLSSRTQLNRLSSVEHYLEHRRSGTRFPSTRVFGELDHKDCFAVRYFDTSADHEALQQVLEEIQAAAEAARLAKLTELGQLQEKRDRLLKQYDESKCDKIEVAVESYRGYVRTEMVHDEETCQRCAYLKHANALWLRVHEWPLPRNENKSKAIIFELQIPLWFAHWRDATVHLIKDVLQSAYSQTLKLKLDFNLIDDRQLGQYSQQTSAQRIVLWSDTKSQGATHYRTKRLSAIREETDVLVANGLRYRLADVEAKSFLMPFVKSASNAESYMYALPDKAKSLQQYIYRPAALLDGPAPNAVVAGQSDCPEHMTVGEWMDLASIPLGHHIQWLNIALQLHHPTVDFSKEETTLFMLQCLRQAGPRSTAAGQSREAHQIATNTQVARLILNHLREALDRIKGNWESSYAIVILSGVAVQMLALNLPQDIHADCLRLLANASKVAHKWMLLLKEQAQDARSPDDRSEFRTKAMEMALICSSCFDLDPGHIAHMFNIDSQASMLLQCSILIAERPFRKLSKAGSLLALLHMRFQRTLGRCQALLSRQHEALDSAIGSVWPAYRSGTGWNVVSSRARNWLEVALDLVDGQQTIVHYDLLAGSLLANGMRLGRPPSIYQQHPTYVALFGTSEVEVMPSSIPGMRYSVTKVWHGHTVHLGWTKASDSGFEDLLVRAYHNNQIFEVIPSRVVYEKYGKVFAENYMHWYNASNGSVEYRPIDDPWNVKSPTSWILRRDDITNNWQLEGRNGLLLAAQSPTSRLISAILSPLALAEETNILLLKSGTEVEIDLPNLQLGFFLDAGSTKLQSREYQGAVVAASQALGTLIGLKNKLILERLDAEDRLVLIPEGPVSYQRVNEHVAVSVALEHIRKVHPLQVESRLGRLVDNGSLQCKLFLAYLHALTSSHIAEPLLRRTGTEQALMILNSAATRSFEQLDDICVDTLSRIAELTPKRSYYPSPEDRSMQIVEWAPLLNPLSQHGGFQKAVLSIFRQATRTRILYPESKNSIPKLQHIEADLLDREMIRSSTFRVSEYGAEMHTTKHDHPYEARHDHQDSARAQNAFILSRMVFSRCEEPYWSSPQSQCLPGLVRDLPTVLGPDAELGEHPMRYDSSLVVMSEQAVLRLLPAIHSLPTKELSSSSNRFSLMIWLATMAFAARPNLHLLQIIAMVFNCSRVRQISPPAGESYRPIEGRTGKGVDVKSKLIATIDEALVPYEQSVDASLPAKDRESQYHLMQRRATSYQQKVGNAAKAFVGALQNKWMEDDLQPPKLGIHRPYLDVEKAMECIKAKFQIFKRNAQLEDYLHKIESAVSALPLLQQPLPLWQLELPSMTASQSSGYFSVDDLFSGPAPELPSAISKLTVLPHTAVKKSTAAELEAPRKAAVVNAMLQRVQCPDEGYERAYLNDLSDSTAALSAKATEEVLSEMIPPKHAIRQHVSDCRGHLTTIYSTLVETMTLFCTHSLFSGQNSTARQHLPRVSPMFFLQQLGRLRWPKLSSNWKKCIVEHALAINAVQRAERLVALSARGDNGELIKELQNVGHTNWSPFEYPESLLLEVESGMMIRDVQEQIAAQMRTPPGGSNSLFQLNMGEGKSSMILPITAAALANGSQLVRVIVAKPQSKQMAQMLTSKLGGLLNRRIFHMPFSRSVKLTKSTADMLESLCHECMTEGGILLVQPEYLLSFQLMALDCYMSGQTEVGRAVLRIQEFFNASSRDIIDESDENLNVKFELIYTVRGSEPVEMTPYRWTYVQQVLDLVKDVVADMSSEKPEAIEYNDRGGGSFPRIRILDADITDDLLARIAKHVCEQGLRGFPVAHHDQTTRQAILTYISKYDLTPAEIKAVESGPFWSEQFQSTLLLLRGFLATGILGFVFGQKRYRVNYGLTSRTPKTRLAVPYRAKDCPSLRSEFSHPDVVIMLTTLSYYYQGLEDEHLHLVLGHLLNADHANNEYENWIRGTDMPREFCQLRGINLRDSACTSAVFPRLRYAKSTIDYFLSHIVFPKELRQFKHKFSASGWDLAKMKKHPTTGFSGTNDSRNMLPLDIDHQDLPEQKHTNALVLGNLLQSHNSVAIQPSTDDSYSTDAERLLDMVVNLEPRPQVILDVGAQILELSNVEVARTWLKMARTKDTTILATVFCDESDELCVVDRAGRVEHLQVSSFASRLDKCLVYLDEAHTRGIDLKLPRHYRAAVTLGANLTKDRLVQACMRMRRLGMGQTVVFCVPGEIDTKIRACTKVPKEESLEVEHVLLWSISETFAEARRSIPLWVTQGHRFVWQQHLWNKVCNGNLGGKDMLSADFVEQFLEPEARSIAYRYRPGRDFDSQLKKMTDPRFLANVPEWIRRRFRCIVEHCLAFDQLQQKARRLQEEQERELSPEVEEQRVVEKAAPASPAQHNLHPDVVKLVETGVLMKTSRGYGPAFATLKHTSAAKDFDVMELDRSNTGPPLMATKDFATTVVKQEADSASDSFQRPVQWIVTIRQRGTTNDTIDHMLLVSPFEAEQLLPRIKVSAIAALHVYKPRCNAGHPPLDKLDLYTIRYQPGSPCIPRHFVVQLNIFAGQLYFSSYGEYVATCDFLGLATEPARSGWQVAADGFILRDDKRRVGGASGLKQSPVKFLKMLLTKVRRHGEDIAKTHVGTMLEGQLLKRSDFEH